MMEKLPEGTVIGQMRASFDWVLSHTARFAGIVVVIVQDSRGFILIDKGKPLAYYFRHGKRVLKGHNAYEYFRSQSAILFELRRYSPEEMITALEIVSAEDKKTPTLESVFLSGDKQGLIVENGAADLQNPVHAISGKTRVAMESGEGPDKESAEPMAADVQSAENLAATVLAQMAGIDNSLYDVHAEDSGRYQERPEDESDIRSFETEDEVVANIGELLLGQIIGLPGVIAVSIFKRGMNILSIGDISLENLIDIAEDLIGSAKEVSSVMKTGPFVQMTLQIPAGNVIIAPYWDEYLCILTRPGINLGQIRKILRDIPAGHVVSQGR
ncbi:MAG TPA: hypothetical protein VMS89_04415 [Methanoregulaceae archaeon]|nr:hypothetical protein [Methanoregulaceae archaeon]